jgi:hypothetical protein
MREIIEVTKADIENAKDGPYLCPVAQALIRIYPQTLWCVYHSSIHGGKVPRAFVSRRMQRFIERFDLGKSIKPTTFEVKWL